MADVADDGLVVTELHLKASLAAQAAKAKRALGAESAFYCVECDEVIAHQRRAAIKGVQLCAPCQADKERKDRQRGKA